MIQLRKTLVTVEVNLFYHIRGYGSVVDYCIVCIQIHDKMNILSLRIVSPSVTYFCFWKKITLTNSQQMGKVNGKLGSAQNKASFYSCLFSLFSQATSVCWKSTENRMTTHLREQERVGEVCLTGEQPLYKVIRLYIAECTMIRTN